MSAMTKQQEIQQATERRYKVWDKGERKYDAFVKKITDRPVITPHTHYLEEFARLAEKSDAFIGLALRELLKNYE